ncbi:uncharacterized protein LOC126410330 [Nymphaea colorata]|nr:uncharacterized protein LOC126410330 [Nymphaea colorata]
MWTIDNGNRRSCRDHMMRTNGNIDCPFSLKLQDFRSQLGALFNSRLSRPGLLGRFLLCKDCLLPFQLALYKWGTTLTLELPAYFHQEAHPNLFMLTFQEFIASHRLCPLTMVDRMVHEFKELFVTVWNTEPKDKWVAMKIIQRSRH